MLSWLDFTVPTIKRSPDQAQASTPNADNEASLEQGQAPGTEAWITTLRAGGRVAMIVPEADTSGWSSPPGSAFLLRGPDYMTSKRKIHARESLLHPLAFDWLSSEARIDNILEHPNSRVMLALDKVVQANPSTGRPKPFVWVFNLQCSSRYRDAMKLVGEMAWQVVAVLYNEGDGFYALLATATSVLQVPSLDHLSAIAYFVTTEQFPEGSLVSRFLNGDNEFRKSRLKLIANIFKGPWVVKAAVGEQAICILGKALTCRSTGTILCTTLLTGFIKPQASLDIVKFAQTDKYMNVDVDIGSSMVATAVVQLAVGYVTTLTVDLAFLLEGQEEDELPERLLGSIRLHNLALDAAINLPVLDYSRRVAFAVAGSVPGGQDSTTVLPQSPHRATRRENARKSKCSRFFTTIRGSCFSPSKCAP